MWGLFFYNVDIKVKINFLFDIVENNSIIFFSSLSNYNKINIELI